MTDRLLIARTDGVIRGTDGALYRTVRGRTLAQPGHPAVEAAPASFSPMVVHLPAPDDGPLEDEVAEMIAEEVAEIRDERDLYRRELAAIVDLLDERNAVPAGIDRSVPGWLVRTLTAILPADLATAADRPVTPPRSAGRSRRVVPPVPTDE